MNCHSKKQPTFLNCVDFLNQYQYLGYLGSGGFGDIFLATYKGIKYAVKVINVSDNEDEILNEIEILCRVKGLENYVQYVNHIKCGKIPDFPLVKKDYSLGKDFYYIIMEFCDTYLKKYLENRILTKNEFLSLVFQMVYGWNKGFEKLGLVHGDFHLQNMLLKFVDEERLYGEYLITGPILKISDFGTSQTGWKTDPLPDFLALNDNLEELFSHLKDPDEILEQFLQGLAILQDENSFQEFLSSDLFLPLKIPIEQNILGIN